MVKCCGDFPMIIKLAQAVQLMALQILMGDLIWMMTMQCRR